MKVLITGTSRGIGEALAARFILREHEVIGCGRSELGFGDYYQVDISDEEQVAAFAGVVRKKYDYIDVLINNAGVALMNHFLTTPARDSQRIININLLGNIYMTQAFVRLLRKSQHGRIINFTSVAVPWNLPGEAIYAASKAAVESLTRTLAYELAPWKITVNAIGPVPTPTDLIGKVPQDKIDALLRRQAIQRMATMDDIYGEVYHFCSPNSDFITGQIVYLGGVS